MWGPETPARAGNSVTSGVVLISSWLCRPRAWEELSWARSTGPGGKGLGCRKSRKTISVPREGPSQVHYLHIPRSQNRIVCEQSMSSEGGTAPIPPVASGSGPEDQLRMGRLAIRRGGA